MSSLIGLSPRKDPLFSFGVISDVQYADITDGRSFLGVPRYYRHSLQVLQRGVNYWNNHKVNFAVNFGDIVDGFCPKDKSLATVKKLVREFEKFNGKVYHIIGNHCLYNAPRETLVSLLNLPISSFNRSSFYDFSPSPEYRFVVLDAYDISVIGWPQHHPKAKEAMKILQEKNPNENKNSPDGLIGLDRRFLMFNGGIGVEQLEWLDGVLHVSAESGQNVIVCSHLPLEPRSASPESLLWNFEEVLRAIHKYGCVRACMAGHDHKGGYFIDSYGVHHRVLEAALECPPGNDAFALVEAYEDRLLLLGEGRMVSSEMVFPQQSSCSN